MRVSLGLFLASSILLADSLTIQKISITSQALESLNTDELKFSRQQDLAQILANYIPSINMVRASAIGNDIVLRGFKRDDINILVDGAKIYGACPNRMDPPLMHISITDVKSISVVKGPFDVENFGSMGGAVVVQSADPTPGLHTMLDAMLGSFSYKKFEAKGSAADKKAGVSFGVSYENAGQYEDGSGKTLVEQNWAKLGKNDPNAYQEKYKDIDAYTRSSVHIKSFYKPTSNQRLDLAMYTDKATNVLYPAFQMDAQLDKTLMVNGKYTINNLSQFSKELQLSSYYSSVVHNMGTEFRNSANNPMMYRTHHVKSVVKGLKLRNSFDTLGAVWSAGIDSSLRLWNGKCYKEPIWQPKQVRIPDVHTLNSALFLKVGKNIDNWDLQAGLRYDDTSIKAKNLKDPTIASIGAIQNYYKGHEKRTFNDLSYNMKVTYHWDENIATYFGYGRGVRVPDGQELYFIGFMRGNWSRRGNPDLKEAKNQEFDVGIDATFDQTHINAELFYSNVDDFIYAYRSNVGNSNPSKYYLTWDNIDAHIWGFSLDAQRSIGDFYMIEAALSYQRGEKDSFGHTGGDKDMAQIPPLHARVALSFDNGDIYWMVEGLASSSWNNYDAGNGEQKIDGWTVVNWKLSKYIGDALDLQIGVDNIFDKTYAMNNTYVGRSLIGGRNPVLINEPGRFFYANIVKRF
ncbi:TonB-dependent receptor [Nitratiruptor sp. YY09-18]|uniref:TonB-dependent receptor n=1 Tax=Nitratiruptor sp. YY09-18 TaxID=2724901 RepID=UPI00191590F1|nr:TonB-dependent receptor [Nitratiruptor sp. YY09-18]BCD68749.1 iron complex outermembrane recepter protein [Nitratiruptor sp. YY09-18]